MKGTLAALFFATGLTDMLANHCPSGCLARTEGLRHVTLAAGPTLFQNQPSAGELFLRYDLARRFGPFQPVAALSITAKQDAWIGLGAAWRKGFGPNRDWFVELSFMPCLYAAGNGPVLGSPLEFRSAIAIGHEFGNGARIALAFDHRSNGDLARMNPGLETLTLHYSIPLR